LNKQQDIELATLRLNWYPYGEHAPFFVALEKGYFLEQGIDLKIISGTGSAPTIELVGNGSNDFGFADAGTMLQMIEKGLPVKAVAVITQINPMSFIFLENSGIRSLKDIIGKKIGVISGGSSRIILPALLEKNKIDPQSVYLVDLPTPEAKINFLLNDKIDAFLGYFIDQPIKIESQYHKKVNYISFNSFGISTLSSSIIVNQKLIRENPSLIKRFLIAVQKGIIDTKANPVFAAEILTKYTDNMTIENCLKQIQFSLSLLNTTESTGLPYGMSKESDWRKTLSILQTYGNLRGSNDMSDYYTNEFITPIENLR